MLRLVAICQRNETSNKPKQRNEKQAMQKKGLLDQEKCCQKGNTKGNGRLKSGESQSIDQCVAQHPMFFLLSKRNKLFDFFCLKPLFGTSKKVEKYFCEMYFKNILTTVNNHLKTFL